MSEITRRKFLAGAAAAAVSAPAVVEGVITTLYPITLSGVPIEFDAPITSVTLTNAGSGYTAPPLSELVAVTRRAFVPKLYTQLFAESPLMREMAAGVVDD